MNRRTNGTRLRGMGGLLLLGVLLLAGSTMAQSPQQEGYDLSWWTVDGGGATFSSGGGYQLGGTIGQADPGTLVGGPYELGGGFWGGGIRLFYIYLPLALRSF